MTHPDLIKAVAADPAVRQALTYPQADGTLVVPSPAALEARASIACQFAIAEMLNWTWVRYQVSVRKKTVTLTDNTYVLDDTILDIVSVTIGTNKRPIDAFWDPKAFTKWRFDYLGQDTPIVVTDQPNTAERYQIFERDSATGKRVMTFEPGIGSDTTADIWYMLPPVSPFSVDAFPGHIHGYVYLVAVNYATGFKFDREVQRIKAMTQERLTNVHGTLDPIPQDPLVEERARIRNFEYSSV